MKKIYFLLLATIALLASACDPMAKINKELDEKENPVSKQTEYTLTKADYSTLAATYVKMKLKDFQGAPEEKKELEAQYKKEAASLSSKQAFNSEASASMLVPSLLQTMFPEWGKGSTILVHYGQLAQPSEALQAVRDIDYIELDEATLKEKGFTSIRNFQDGAEEAIAQLAREKGAKKEAILVKLSLDGDSRYVLIDGRLFAGSDVYYPVQPEDYKAMGLKYGNFSSSALPDDYLPTLLGQQFPYAKEGTTKVVVYVWYSKGESSARASEYSLNAGVWAPTSQVDQKSDQFLHNGNEWLFDPTIVFTLGAEDFALLFDYVKANHPNYVSKKYPTNEEYWFGGSGYYKNFNLDGGETVGARTEEEGLSPEELLKVKEERVVEAIKLVLQARFPNYPAVVNGVDQYYIAHTVVRVNRNNENRTYRFKGLGNNEYQLEK